MDYYAVLQVQPDCDERVLEMAFHHFAKMYHPDNPKTSDEERFHATVEAYNILKDPKEREIYDSVHAGQFSVRQANSTSSTQASIGEDTTLKDAEVRNSLLLELYKRRREFPTDAGITGWLLQETLALTEEAFEFHMWYLKSKDCVEIDDQGKLAITVCGVDQVVSQSRMKKAEKLLISDTNSPSSEA
ncbi:J domain-containing protein [Erythrobacter sp. MTPC3]|uniref:J domain-containing protein n=1 Tax=Erythrobacter sp. MTPC3 TaxID=3056564 RepID=UPI0036F1E011